MCNTTCTELIDKKALVQKSKVTLGGIVTAVNTGFTRNNQPRGFVTLEDFSGSGDLALYGEEWGRWNSYFVDGSAVYIQLQFYQKYPNSDFISVRVLNVEYMETVKNNGIEQFTIVCDSDKINEETVEDLTSIIKSSPGKTKLSFQLIDREQSYP